MDFEGIPHNYFGVRCQLLAASTNRSVKQIKKEYRFDFDACPLKFMDQKIALHHTKLAQDPFQSRIAVALHVCELAPYKLMLFHLSCDSMHSNWH